MAKEGAETLVKAAVVAGGEFCIKILEPLWMLEKRICVSLKLWGELS